MKIYFTETIFMFEHIWNKLYFDLKSSNIFSFVGFKTLLQFILNVQKYK